MRRRSRLLRVAKWGGAMVCVVLIAAGVANLWCSALWVLRGGYGLFTAGGLVGVSWRVWYDQYPGLVMDDATLWQFWPLFSFEARVLGKLAIASPIWFMLLTIGVPTLVAWRLDRRRRRLRTFTLWTGTLLSVLIAAAFVASARWQIAFQVPSGPALYLVAGSVLIVIDEMPTVLVSIEPHIRGLLRWNAWVFQRLGSKLNRGPTIIVTYIGFPLWLAFAAVAVPTLLAWRFWPKPVKPGHCRCGYDLTGNESGTCPECGTRV